MKKILLSSAAVAGLLMAATPALAQIEVTVGGHSKNYVGWLDQDEAAAATSEARSFDMLRESELHFQAQGTADNGLTYGAVFEIEADAGDSSTNEESYLFLSGDWGRVNLGSEDGANYLLQVAAPSADSNIDGLRQYIQPVNYDSTVITGAYSTAVQTTFAGANILDYDNDATGIDEKITYLSPVFSGFQVGASYTPDVASNATEDVNSASGLNGFADDDTEDNFGSGYDLGARYEGNFNNVGVALGGGYTMIDVEQDAVGNNSDDLTEWNVGLDLDIGAFGIGAIYTEQQDGPANDGAESETIAAGVDYTTGPFVLGASYLTSEAENAAGTQELETDRYTGGVVYTAAEGLTFRGSVSHVEHELTGNADFDATSVLGGVQFNF